MIDRETAVLWANNVGMINFDGANWQCVTNQIQELVAIAQSHAYERAAQIVDQAVDGSFRSRTAKKIREMKQESGGVHG